MSRGLTPGTVRDLVRVFLIGGLVVAVAAGAATFRIFQQGDRDEERPADAIVVLGAAQYDGRPSPVFEARLEHAMDLWHRGLAKAFVVTGGKLPGDRTTEAAVARAYAVAHGVPASAIFGEDRAHNTLDSLHVGRRASCGTGVSRSAVFVSDPTHMLRVLRIADDLGIDAYGSPTDDLAAPARPAAQGPGRHPRAGCARGLLPVRRGGAGRDAGRLTANPSRAGGNVAFRRPKIVRGKRALPSWNARVPAVHSASAFRPEGTAPRPIDAPSRPRRPRPETVTYDPAEGGGEREREAG